MNNHENRLWKTKETDEGGHFEPRVNRWPSDTRFEVRSSRARHLLPAPWNDGIKNLRLIRFHRLVYCVYEKFSSSLILTLLIPFALCIVNRRFYFLIFVMSIRRLWTLRIKRTVTLVIGQQGGDSTKLVAQRRIVLRPRKNWEQKHRNSKSMLPTGREIDRTTGSGVTDRRRQDWFWPLPCKNQGSTFFSLLFLSFHVFSASI